MGKKKKDPDTQKFLFGKPVNNAAKDHRAEGGGVPGSEHAGDHRYHFVRGKGWILKPEYGGKK